jgi:hypothetical protein
MKTTRLTTATGEMIAAGKLQTTQKTGPFIIESIEVRGYTHAGLVDEDATEQLLVFALDEDFSRGALLSLPRIGPGVWCAPDDNVMIGGREYLAGGCLLTRDDGAFIFSAAVSEVPA